MPAGGRARVVDLVVATLLVDNVGAELVVVPRGSTLARLLHERPYVPSEREPGRLSFLQLNTPDPEASLAFYGEAMGWSSLPASNDVFTYFYLANEGEVVAGMLTIDERSGDVVPGWQCYLHADGVTQATEAARTAGAAVLVRPTNLRNGDFSVLWTRAGALVALDDMERDELLP